MAEGDKAPDNEAVALDKKKRGSLVIFAVDVSGSMCTTTEVPALQGGNIYTHSKLPSVHYILMQRSGHRLLEGAEERSMCLVWRPSRKQL